MNANIREVYFWMLETNCNILDMPCVWFNCKCWFCGMNKYVIRRLDENKDNDN